MKKGSDWINLELGWRRRSCSCSSEKPSISSLFETGFVAKGIKGPAGIITQSIPIFQSPFLSQQPTKVSPPPPPSPKQSPFFPFSLSLSPQELRNGEGYSIPPPPPTPNWIGLLGRGGGDWISSPWFFKFSLPYHLAQARSSPTRGVGELGTRNIGEKGKRGGGGELLHAAKRKGGGNWG